MAHRNIKITRDIVQTCNKLRVFNKLEQGTFQPHKSIGTTQNASHDVSSNKIHYSASYKNEALNSDAILSEVNASKYTNGNIECSLQKQKNLPETECNLLSTQNFETELMTGRTIPLTTATRFYSSSSKDGKRDRGCITSKKCVRNPNCPKYSIEDCTPARGSDCKRLYQDPCCTKKLAPYPSYSELCAFRMEEDPSECHQCPWQKCRGVDDIKPQGKKSYHTSTNEMNMAMIPTKSAKFSPFVFENQCDAKKEPCKEPPPKCKDRDKTEKEKCPEKKKKPKKCETLLLAGEPWVISGSLRKLDLEKPYYSNRQLDLFLENFDGPPNLVKNVKYRLKDCPGERRKCPKHEIVPPQVDHTINEKYKPRDPCCTDVKRGRQPPKRPKVFIPERRNY